MVILNVNVLTRILHIFVLQELCQTHCRRRRGAVDIDFARADVRFGVLKAAVREARALGDETKYRRKTKCSLVS